MIRAIMILVAFALAASSAVGQEQSALENPFRIFMDDKAIAALKTTPEGLIWSFQQSSQVEHDGVHVYYETRASLASPWSANDKTTQDLFSLDVDDELLDVLVNDPSGLPAPINPLHRGRIRGVLLRYTPSPTAGLAPDPNMGPIGNDAPSLDNSSGSNSAGSGTGSSQFNSLLDARSKNKQLNAIRDPRDEEADRMLQSWQAQRNDASKTAQSQNFSNARSPFASENNNLPSFAANSSRQQTNPQSASDRFASTNAQTDSVLSPPPRQTVQPDQTYRQEMLVGQPARNSYSYVPQVALNDPNLMPASNVGTNTNAVMSNNTAASAEISALNQQLLVAQKTLDEAGRRQVFLLFMLFMSIGICLYLAWLARGFYFRYSELADELRETFTSTN